MRDGNFYYSAHILRTIGEHYMQLYEGISFKDGGDVITAPLSLAEFKADFDTSLKALGRGKWCGIDRDFKNYRPFGKLQRLIIADIMGVDDKELERQHFVGVPRMRGYAYYRMKCYLNGER